MSESVEATLARIGEDQKRASADVARLLRYVATHLLDVGFRIEDVKLAFGQQAGELIAAFDVELGVRLDDYIAEAQLEVAVRLFAGSDLSATRISEVLGYYSPADLTNAVQRCFGIQPGKLRAVLRSAVISPQRLATVTPVSSPLPPIETARITRRLAESLWEFLARFSFPEQLVFLRQNALLGAEDLFELLSRRSREAQRRDRGSGVELAELALATIEGSAALLGERYIGHHALALVRLGNARRLAGDLKGANEAFQRVEGLWTVPEPDRDRHIEAEILSLEASLRLDERRFDQALVLLDRSLERARENGDVQLQVNLLLQRIAVNGYRDRPQATLPDLAEAEELLETQAKPDRIKLLGLYQDHTLVHLETDHAAEAKKYLSRARALCEELDHTPSRHQLQWIEGRLAKADGEEASAERLFGQAHAGFEGIGDRDAAALAALDLAILCQEQGRFSEVVELVAGSVIPVFEELRLAGEFEEGLKLLREAVAAQAVTLAVLCKARELLLRRQRDPAVRARHPEK
ncbi:MAG: helix-turn-helix transcriptional regulator [bacterium]|nr:helix-turn-helix transcriptional regulator [bacterium]